MENHPEGGGYISLSKTTQTFKIHRRAGKERSELEGKLIFNRWVFPPSVSKENLSSEVTYVY